MNRIPSRGRLRKRIAALTAVSVGAALATVPGAATAQEATASGIDCAALGGNPIAAGLEAALEAAIACDVEVRIDSRSAPHATLYATPDRQLHYVGTAAPEQDNLDRGPADPTLVESDGVLMQANAGWTVRLSGSDTTAPLLATDGVTFDWSGAQPAPVHDGATAVYDELAPGLDLTVETAASWADLTFTVADETAWDAFDTGLSLTTAGTVTLPGDSLLVTGTDGAGAARWDVSAPFTVHDAAGTTIRADLTRTADGALRVILAEGEAQFPLAVTTAWTGIGTGAAWWGAVTSAQPGLSLFRGGAGLDQPYFEAAGAAATAVVGDYCDGLADPNCEGTASAAAYWSFWNPALVKLLPSEAAGVVSFAPVRGTFRVDAAEASACTAPALTRTGTYLPTHYWGYQPSVSAVTAAGACEDGTAVYDVTRMMSGPNLPGTLAMLGGTETARFDGDSARMDAYFSISNFTAPVPPCFTDPDSRNVTDSVNLSYGKFYARNWRPDLFGSGMTWAATVRNRDTGAVLASTEPVPVVSGWTAGSVIAAPGEGRYVTEYEFVADDPSRSFNLACYAEIDTSAPEVVSIEVLPGPRNVGGTVTLAITVSDNAFPNGVDYRWISYSATSGDSEFHDDYATQSGTSHVTVPLLGAETTVSVRVEDQLGRFDEASTSVIAQDYQTDFDGDGDQDLMVVRKSDGALMFYPGKGDGTFGAGVSKGTGWGGLDLVMAGDLTGDGNADVLARDTRNGNLWTYPGNGTGGLESRVVAGSGWNTMSMLTSGGDFDENGTIDLLATGKSDGKLYFYPGRGNGTFSRPTVVGSGWKGMEGLTTIGDVDHDGHTDIMALRANGGNYVIYSGTGTAGFKALNWLDTSLRDSMHTERYSQVIGAGDLDGDGSADLLGIDARTGELDRATIDESGIAASVTRVGTSWGAMRLPLISLDGVYDFTRDGYADIIARSSSWGTGYLYSGNGKGGFLGSGQFGVDVGDATLIETAGDMDADGTTDFLVRDQKGDLYLNYGRNYQRRIGTGWNGMSAIVSGHDFNGDGKVDIIAREKSTGYLWLYPGKGNGYVGSRVKIGSGWNGMREITAVGDLDHDGHADILAIRSADNCMYFYGGRGNGTLKPGVKQSCNWTGYDQVAAVGDFNGDGLADWVARRKSDGALFLYKGNGTGGYSARSQIGTGWNAMNMIA
ncbi:VCBS repeat-containing protein [Glycomyces sp. NPDC021274]|uniref:FG-GAP repeat domain-containing protein n=1 Tax=Glycomyces sp. NPDC021274 TaxID=3155120 RepID=UPI0033E65EA9